MLNLSTTFFITNIITCYIILCIHLLQFEKKNLNKIVLSHGRITHDHFLYTVI